MVIKAVIGSNYGDEGKGLMTDYFCHEAIQKGTCLNVLTNGGSQRGHTVCADGVRHIFHHFGAGTIAGATTYIPKQYVCNPITYVMELKELRKWRVYPKVIYHPETLVSTPFDMIYNMLYREHENKHNSCGYGIYETKVRNGKSIKYYSSLDWVGIKKDLIEIRDDYYDVRMFNNGIQLDEKWKEIYYSDELIKRFMEDIEFMMNEVRIEDEDILNKYDTLVFENAQGLLLDKDYDPEYGTSSNTGLKAVEEILRDTSIQEPIDACYVSRTYLTRHGDGNLKNECDLAGVKPDETNIFNQHQGHLRYAPLNPDELYERILNDLVGHKAHYEIAFTHADEIDIPYPWFKNMRYVSAGKNREDIHIYVV